MPGVAALVAKAAAVVAGAASSAGVGGLIGKAIITAGLSFAQRALQGKPKFGRNQPGQTVSIRNSVEPRRLVYGETRIGGIWTFYKLTGNSNQYLHMVYTLCDGPIDSVQKVYFGDKELSLDPDGFDIDEFKNKARVKVHLGDESELAIVSPTFDHTDDEITEVAHGLQDDDLVRLSVSGGSLPNGLISNFDYYVKVVDSDNFQLRYSPEDKNVAGFTSNGSGTITVTRYPVDPLLVYESDGDWTYEHQLLGIAYLYIRFEYQRSKYPNGLPDVSALVRGRNDIYDPRDLSTGYSKNPALAWEHYLRLGPELGPGVPQASINETLVESSADRCDESVSRSSQNGGGSENRYEINGLITLDETPEDILSSIRQTMSARSTFTNFQWNLYAGEYQAPTFEITEDAIVGAFVLSNRIRRDKRINFVKGTYISNETNWQPFSFPSVGDHNLSTTYETDDGGQHMADLELRLTASGTAAQRLAKIQLLEARLEKRVSIICNHKALPVEAGKVVSLTYPVLGFNQDPFYVEEVGIDLNSGEFQIELKEASSTQYDWTPSTEEQKLTTPNDLSSSTPVVSPVRLNPFPEGAALMLLNGQGLSYESGTRKVSNWADQSGSGNDASQSVSANRPIYDEANRYIYGGSTERWLEMSTAIIPTSSGASWMIGFRCKPSSGSAANDNMGILTQWNTGPGNSLFRWNAVTTAFEVYIAGASIVQKSVSAGAEHVGIFYRHGTEFGIWVDSGAFVTASNSTVLESTATHVGGDASFTSALHANDRIYDIVLYDDDYSVEAAERLQRALLCRMETHPSSIPIVLSTDTVRTSIRYSHQKAPLDEESENAILYGGGEITLSDGDAILTRAFKTRYEPSALASKSLFKPADDLASKLRLALDHTGFTVNPDPVGPDITGWSDSGPDSIDFDGATSNEPQIAFDEINTYRVAQFDGSQWFESTDNDSIIDAQPPTLSRSHGRTIIFIAKSSVATSQEHNPLFDASDEASPGPGEAFLINFVRDLEVRTTNGYTKWSTELNNDTWAVVTVRWDGRRLQGEAVEVRVNGYRVSRKGSIEGTNEVIDTDNGGTGVARIGKSTWLGGGTFFTGHLAEFLYFDEALKSNEMQDVENYLIAKFQIDIV